MIDGVGRNFDDKLTRFLEWYMKNPQPIKAPRGKPPVHFVEGVTGVVIFRLEEYQVQLFTVAPNVVIPAHHHPNVDSYEVSLWGVNFYLYENGQKLEMHPSVMREGGHAVRVLPDADHGATASKHGGCFLSVQRWLNGVTPSSVGNDWVGKETMGDSHSEQIING